MATAATLKTVFVALVAAAFCAPAAQAGLISGLVGVVLPTCGSTTQPFAQWEDYNAYYPVPNNGLENGSTGWSLGGGAYVGYGNETFYVGGYGTRSLVLPPGATGYSPSACINLTNPHVRAFAKSNGANGPLRIQVIFYGLTGNLTGVFNVADQDPAGFTSWQPTTEIPSILALPLGTAYFKVKFTSLSTSGTWQVDDLFVDPWSIGA